MENLYCATFGCNTHDYRVSAVFCAYQYEMERSSIRNDQIRDMLQLISAAMPPDTAASPQPVPASRPAQKPTQRRSGGGGVPL